MRKNDVRFKKRDSLIFSASVLSLSRVKRGILILPLSLKLLFLLLIGLPMGEYTSASSSPCSSPSCSKQPFTSSFP